MLIFVTFLISVIINAAFANNCQAPQSHESFVDKSTVHIVKNSSEALQQFMAIYENPNRLRNRIYWSKALHSFVYLKKNQEHRIPNSFLMNVRHQILQALLLQYADYLYYADLGHFHILAPENQKALSLSDPNLLNLYHSGELYQFKKNGTFSEQLTNNTHWLWIYKMRNFVGKNQKNAELVSVFAPEGSVYNTVRKIDGYKEVGSASISANKNGCFSLSNSDLYNWRFDLSIEF